MRGFVLDACVALAWIMDEPVPAYALKVKQSLGTSRALVPPLWILEVANALTVSERRRNLDADQVMRAMSVVESLLDETVEIVGAAVEFRQIVATARSLRLTAYDALYLETARREGVPLATLDKALRSAAARTGVELFT